MFKKKYVEIDPFYPTDLFKIKLNKDNVDFTIQLKQTTAITVNYVWFMHVYIKEQKQFRLIAFSTKSYSSEESAHRAALNYFNSLSPDIIKNFKN